MMEKEANLILDSFSSAMPYLEHPEELKELIQREIKASDSVEKFIGNFEEKISAINDVTRRTDSNIFLNELRRAIHAKR